MKRIAWLSVCLCLVMVSASFAADSGLKKWSFFLGYGARSYTESLEHSLSPLTGRNGVSALGYEAQVDYNFTDKLSAYAWTGKLTAVQNDCVDYASSASLPAPLPATLIALGVPYAANSVKGFQDDGEIGLNYKLGETPLIPLDASLFAYYGNSTLSIQFPSDIKASAAMLLAVAGSAYGLPLADTLTVSQYYGTGLKLSKTLWRFLNVWAKADYSKAATFGVASPEKLYYSCGAKVMYGGNVGPVLLGATLGYYSGSSNYGTAGVGMVFDL